MEKDKLEKEASNAILEKVGRDLLGTEAERADVNVIRTAGLIGAMGSTYSLVKKIPAASVVLEFCNLKVNFLDKQGELLDTMQVTREDIANPSQWHDRLLAETREDS